MNKGSTQTEIAKRRKRLLAKASSSAPNITSSALALSAIASGKREERVEEAEVKAVVTTGKGNGKAKQVEEMEVFLAADGLCKKCSLIALQTCSCFKFTQHEDNPLVRKLKLKVESVPKHDSISDMEIYFRQTQLSIAYIDSVEVYLDMAIFVGHLTIDQLSDLCDLVVSLGLAFRSRVSFNIMMVLSNNAISLIVAKCYSSLPNMNLNYFGSRFELTASNA